MKIISGSAEMYIGDSGCNSLYIVKDSQEFNCEDQDFIKWCQFFIPFAVGGIYLFEQRVVILGKYEGSTIKKVDSLTYSAKYMDSLGELWGIKEDQYKSGDFMRSVVENRGRFSENELCYLISKDTEDNIVLIERNEKTYVVRDEDFLDFMEWGGFPRRRYGGYSINHPVFADICINGEEVVHVKEIRMVAKGIYEYKSGDKGYIMIDDVLR